MNVHITFRCGGAFHQRGVAVIRDWGSRIEVSHAGESPVVFQPETITSMRIEPDALVASAGAACCEEKQNA
jgi:hypothetical protein